MKKIHFLSGLPRAGSTLLSAILDQNPNVHAEGNSALCQLMWDAHVSVMQNSAEQITANRKQGIAKSIVSSIPEQYYANTDKPIIIDKCRSWTLPPNLELVEEYISKDAKFLVLVRPVEEVVKSFVNVYKENGRFTHELPYSFLHSKSEPLMRAYDSVLNAKRSEDPRFHFITYSDLVSDTKRVISDIYDFLELDAFDHDLTDIKTKVPEDDTVYGLIGLHDIRPTVSAREVDIDLPEEVIKVCKLLSEQIGL